jgi:hypothetical protein
LLLFALVGALLIEIGKDRSWIYASTNLKKKQGFANEQIKLYFGYSLIKN